MSGAWVVVLAVGVGTMAIKATGPVLLGGRPLPAPVQAVQGTRLELDARLIGLAAAALALLLRVPVLLVVIIAAAAAAVARLAGLP